MAQTVETHETIEPAPSNKGGILFSFPDSLSDEELEFLEFCRSNGLAKAAAARMLVIEALRARRAA